MKPRVSPCIPHPLDNNSQQVGCYASTSAQQSGGTIPTHVNHCHETTTTGSRFPASTGWLSTDRRLAARVQVEHDAAPAGEARRRRHGLACFGASDLDVRWGRLPARGGMGVEADADAKGGRNPCRASIGRRLPPIPRASVPPAPMLGSAKPARPVGEMPLVRIAEADAARIFFVRAVECSKLARAAALWSWRQWLGM